MGLPVLFSCVLMVLFAGPSLSAQIVTGIVGQSVTLPCDYSVQDEGGVTSMCWGRGPCPLNKCSNEIIWTDGQKVTFQYSSRYHLKENLTQGIVSLTIYNLTEEDAGKYCCRVELSGWFNDKKVTIRLKVEQASTVTALTTPASTRPMLTTLTSSASTRPMLTTLTSSASTHPVLTTTKDQKSVFSTPVMDIVTTRSPATSDGKNWTQPGIPIGENDTGIATSEGYQSTNKTVILQDQLTSSNKGIYIGVGVLAGVLLVMILLVFVLKRYFNNKKKAQSLSLTFLAHGIQEDTRTTNEGGGIHVEDNVYAIEENVYTVEPENAYIIEEENPYVIETYHDKQQPPKVWP
ncbi:hepatitis A virus cellular receptor 1 homolog isoform X2 [Monodelphis domestica]|uniref:hepatitis A virus cellular receptor 1 homolog isoform X2 n=1 Tax=Monodelphis domestica TaxID=13616 RepID=UPI0004431D8E|nr:hepatitis A virus cellular receptor 1 homolog isoform X2 [Monodelphis domestica]